jgi:hydrogenase large subunit
MTMKKTVSIRMPLNRVEGDLEVHAEIAEGVISEAFSVGTMYRGFENLLTGRAPLDSLVITPRICGICSTAHLKAAAKALDVLFHAAVPGNGKRVRNITLMTEQIQNDIRHSFLLFCPDLTRPAYGRHPLFEEAVGRYLPLKGETTVQAIRESKKLLEIIALLGGQWPHSSFMVPGGVVSVPTANEVNQCRSLMAGFRQWYERRILGCDLQRWEAVDGPGALSQWLEETASHRDSEVGFFVRFARQAGMTRIGGGHGRFVSFGALDIPEGSAVSGPAGGSLFWPGGVVDASSRAGFDPAKITEDIGFSHFSGYAGGLHPSRGMTVVNLAGIRDPKRSWAKAPRYDGLPAEAGPLAEMLVAGEPLISGLVSEEGPSVFVRQLARMIRPAKIIAAIDTWLKELATSGENFYGGYEPIEFGEGAGLIEAHRGALGHWVTIENGKIARYQVITPTTWNASPRDSAGRRGPLEEALVGTPVADPEDPVELEAVVRSFDPCLVCTVHCIRGLKG